MNADDGRVTVVINRYVAQLDKVRHQLSEIASSVEGVRDVQSKVGPHYKQPDIYPGLDDEDLPPKILLSPSVTTGYDFPYDDCRYQILGKLPYPDTRDPLTKARAKGDKEYTAYVTMQALMQSCGRSVRSADDFAENFIIDDNILWFMSSFGHFATQWFRQAFKSSRLIPEPPPLYGAA